jgi:hypothetical protein
MPWQETLSNVADWKAHVPVPLAISNLWLAVGCCAQHVLLTALSALAAMLQLNCGCYLSIVFARCRRV